MKRIVDPLRQMGAKIQGQGEKHTAPLEIEGGPLTGIDYTLPVASAQLKSCLLLAGLFANGTTSVTEKTPSRDHTERLLAHFHAPPVIDVEPDGTGKTIRVRGGTRLHGARFQRAGRFFLRRLLDRRRRRAARRRPDHHQSRPERHPHRPAQRAPAHGRPHPRKHFRFVLRAGRHRPRLRPQAARHARSPARKSPTSSTNCRSSPSTAALAEGDTEIRDAQELRVKETDRIAAMADNLRAFGVTVTEHDDGMTIHGGATLTGAQGRQLRRSPHRHGLRHPRPLRQGRNDHRRNRLHRHLLPDFQEDLLKIAHFRETGFALGLLGGG